MRKDTQIGIILGAVILIVIGVFLSTRPSVKKQKTPDLTLSEEGVSEVEEIEEIDISELLSESKTEAIETIGTAEETAEEVVFVEERQIRKEFGKKAPVEETPVKKDEAVIEGRWEGVEAEIEVAEKDIPEISIPEKEIEKVSESITIPEKEQEISSVGIRGDIIHKVETSDSLIKLSKKYYGDETKWTKIHEANEDKIPNPNILHTGLELLIPGITVLEKEEADVRLYDSLDRRESDDKEFTTAKTHIVSHGDTLYSIAKQYYGNSAMWEKIYKANEDNIIDKRLLEIGQTLIIPE
ncbi:MAG: LysM peptidoglycan-binding domain-containing protein [Planctomycetota bacterium]|jgi:nucleoid-associated protein YgaU